MRIVHVTNAGGFGRVQSGGAERAVAELASELSERHGWDEHIVAPAEFFGGRAIGDSVVRHAVPLEAFGTSQLVRPGGNLGNLLREIDPDIVVGHLLRGTLVGLPAASGTRAKRVSILHNSLSDYRAEPGHRALKHAVNRFAFRQVSRRSVDLHVAISEANRDDLVRHEHIPAENVVTIHNWVSDAFSPDAANERDTWRAEHGIPAGAKVVAIAGRLESQKNQELAIRLLTQLPGHELVLAGDGALADDYHRLADQLGVADRVHLIGFQPEVAGVMAAADMVAVPSRFEGFGRTVIEALAVGTPVAATDLPAIAEVLRGAPAESFALCPLGDEPEWVSAIGRLTETGLRDSALGEEVRAFIETNYSLEAAGARYNEVFDALVQGTR